MKQIQTQAEKKSLDFEQPKLSVEDPLFHEPIQLNKFMSLCDLHHSIIQEYKLSQSCSNKASVCRKGCPNAQKQHKFMKNQHESISAKKFYSQFDTLRQAYFSILTKLRDNAIPQFMARIRVQLQELENSLKEEINSNGLELVQKLCHVNHKSVNKLLKIAQQPKIQQIELSQLACRDVYLFKELAKIIPKYIGTLNEEKENNTINQFIQSGFVKMLKSKGYLSSLLNDKTQLSTNIKRIAQTEDGPIIKSQIPVLIDVNEINQIPQRLLELLTTDEQDSNGEVQEKKKIGEIETLNVKIRSQMREMLENFSSNEQSNLSSQIKELQSSFNILQSYLLKVKPSKLYLSINIALDNNIVIDNLATILTKCKSLKTLIMYTSKQAPCEEEESYLQQQVRLYSDGVKITVEYSVSWDGGQHQSLQQAEYHQQQKQAATNTINNQHFHQTLIKLLK